MKQITVVVSNAPGQLADVTQVLAAHDVNIEEINAERMDELGVITMAVDRYDDALRALSEAGYQAISQDALVIRIEDRPGALARIATRFKEAGINLRSMHIIHREDGASLVSIVTADNPRAEPLVRDVLVGAGSSAGTGSADDRRG